MDPGFRLDGRYRMEHRADRYGPAEVWRARDELLARPVAVTLVGVRRSRRDLRQRLRDAARAAAALHHPNIVATYDYGEADGPGGDALTYVVTEFLSGESLAARLARGLPEPHEAVDVCAQLADALAAAHSCGVAHGDLRPGQVFLTAEGVKLLGLGVAGAIREPQDAPDGPGGSSGPTCPDGPSAGRASGPGGPSGSDGLGGEAGQAEDVLALGRVIAECLTGTPDSGPWSDTTDRVTAEPAALADRCRAGDPGDRPAAAEVAMALAAHARTVRPPAAPVGGAAASPARRLRRLRRAAVLGGAAAVVLAVVLAPLAVVGSALTDGPRGVALPPLPTRPATQPPAGPGAGGDGDRAAPPATAAPAGPPGAAVPAARTRAVAVSALSRMRRAIDVGMAEGEVGARFGNDLATQVTTLMNEVDGGEPVDLRRRVARLRAALAGGGPGEVSPERAAGLSALLAEVPIQS